MNLKSITPASTAGLSILAGGLAFVGSAGHLGAVDLLVNGSFEEPPAVGWTGSFGTYNFSAAYFAGPAIPAGENPGALYSWRHGIGDSDFSGPLTQKVALSSGASNGDIDAGRAVYKFSAWMSSFTDDPEAPYVTVQFLDALDAPVGDLVALDRTSPTHFITFADGTTVFDRATHEHHWAKYLTSAAVPAGARGALVGVTRSPNAGLGGRPDTYTDLVKLDVSTSFPPSLISAAPQGTGIRPDAALSFAFLDGSSQISPDTAVLSFDGLAVTPTVQRTGPNTSFAYQPPGLLPPGSSHTARLIVADGGTPPIRLTNELLFVVADYYNLLLPTPLFLETFETTPEGSLPAGWTGVSYSAAPDLNVDLGDLNSAAYTNFTVVDSARFNSPLLIYNAHTSTEAYKRVLTSNPLNVLNGQPVQSLAQGKIVFSDSGYRDGGYQVMYLYSPDFDLTGQTNVYLSFNSLWEQNQDSIAAVEYSIDQGATWLPLSYLIDRNDLVLDGDGKLDPAATFGTPRGDIATYLDPLDGQPRGGNYGAFIGVDAGRWSQLGSYISPRIDDDPTGSKRIETFRLAAADNQSKVRLRFAHAGTDSWYWGLDNIGFYSIRSLTAPLVKGPTPATITEATGNSASFSAEVIGVGPFTHRWVKNGSAVAGQTNLTLALGNLSPAQAGSYRLEVSYVGGTILSAPGALAVFAAPPSLVLGQWDFDQQSLAATCGRDLDYFDSFAEVTSGFADANFFGLPPLGGANPNVLSFQGAQGEVPFGGYKMRHGLGGTDGGTNVNQYTLIYDLLFPAGSDRVRRTLLQTDSANLVDGSFRVDENNGVGVNGVYQGKILPDTWYRLALAVDLAGPGPHPVVVKFINGLKVGTQVLPEGLDGRWSLSTDPSHPYALLFGDNDTNAAPSYVSSVQLRSGRLSDAAISAMGGPAATKVPGAICIKPSGNVQRVFWSGTVLESADSLGGAWSTVNNATKPYTPPAPLQTQKFFRAR